MLIREFGGSIDEKILMIFDTIVEIWLSSSRKAILTKRLVEAIGKEKNDNTLIPNKAGFNVMKIIINQPSSNPKIVSIEILPSSF